MHIVYVGPVPPFRGGISQHGARVVAALSGAGHDVAVRSWGAQYPRALYPGEPRDAKAIPPAGARFDLNWYSPASWWRAGREARGADLLVFPWVTPVQAPAYRVMLGAAGATAAVALVHNPLPHERRAFDRPLTAGVLRRLRGAVVHAGTAREVLLSIAPGLPVVVVPLPPNLDLSPTPLPGRPPLRLLFLGFVRPYKGLDVAIEALAILRKDGMDATLTVAGEFWGPVDPWREQIHAAGLDGAVEIRPGYASDAETAALLSSHHLVVAPYRTATQSAIVPLAYAAGRPVAATTAGGLSEVVKEGVTGALALPGDAPGFAAAVRRVAENLPPMAANATKATTSWGDVAHAIIAIAGGGRRPGST